MKILIISDIHGNAEALNAVLTAENDADRIIFLGDALLSGPQALATAQRMAELKIDISIMGNHDKDVLEPALYVAYPNEWVALNNGLMAQLEPEHIRALESYKPAGRFQIGDLDMYLHHGQLDKAIPPPLPDAPDDSFRAIDQNSECQWVLFGHTHVQFSRHIDGKTYINPGSVGQPRCGKLHACYGVFEDGIYSPRQVTYDPVPWLDALENLTALEPYPEFRQWLSEGLLSGYGIGEKEPWTRYNAEGFN